MKVLTQFIQNCNECNYCSARGRYKFGCKFNFYCNLEEKEIEGNDIPEWCTLENAE